MAVKPWIGAIREPDNRKLFNNLNALKITLPILLLPTFPSLLNTFMAIVVRILARIATSTQMAKLSI